MENIKTEIYLPAYGISVDFMLPAYVNVGQLIGQMLAQLNEHHGIPAFSNAVLLDAAQKGVLDPNKDLCSQGVKNGSRLYMI